MTEPNWGPSGEIVYNRTYSRVQPDGSKETWADTVRRVVDGNLALVDSKYHEEGERETLIQLMEQFKVIPAGRHLWMSGVPGRQFLSNCHVAGWTDKIEDHFTFTLLRLAEGGGVGTNYSSEYTSKYHISRDCDVLIVCDPSHPDYESMQDAGILTDLYSSDWTGSIDVEDSREGWSEAVADLFRAFTNRTRHSKRVYDVSRVRWSGARIKSFGGTASGPLPLAKMLLGVASTLKARATATGWQGNLLTPIDAMDIDHEIAQCIVAGGVRRSARMSILPWNDPYIAEFLDSKSDPGRNWTTNISVGIDSTFIKEAGGAGLKAWGVFNLATEAMLKNGEPGFWNMELSQVGEPNPVIATNPCGEITLEAWENCNLGHVNLDAFVQFEDGCALWDKSLLEAHRLMTRFLIRATYGDFTDGKQSAVVAKNRRIGVGHFGYAGAVAKLGVKFSESHEDQYIQNSLEELYSTVRKEARSYSNQLRIPEPVKVTTVAPTGSVAKMPGRTEGIHPPYAKYFIRRIRFSVLSDSEFNQLSALEAQGFQSEPDQYDTTGKTWVVSIPTKEELVQELEDLGIPEELVESVDQISLEDLLAVQAMYQERYADNAVSFTANIPQGKYSLGEFRSILLKWLPKLKGTTVMPDESRPQAPYERITKEQYEAAVARAVDSSVDDDCASGACPVR